MWSRKAEIPNIEIYCIICILHILTNFTFLNVLSLGLAPHPPTLVIFVLFFRTNIWKIYLCSTGCSKWKTCEWLSLAVAGITSAESQDGELFLLHLWNCDCDLVCSPYSLSLYGGLIGIFNHGIHLKGITLLGNALLCTSVLFVISDAGQRVCQEVSNVIVRVSVRTMYFHNYCLVSPIK